jgi:xylulokinase
MRVLALDVGTSSVKAALLDAASGDPIGGIARVEYTLDRPTPEAAEIAPDRLWSAVAAAGRQAARATPEAVEAIGLSSLTPALVLLDSNDRPAAPIWTHLDRRSRPAARQIWATVGEEFLATTGNRPLPGGISAVSWRQQLNDDPYLARRVRRYLHANSWLVLRMTGETAFDPANASFSGLFATMGDRAWSPRWCEYFEVDPAWLPSVLSGDATVGTLRSAVAAELGVPPGIPVKIGTADTSSAMLAAGMGPDDLLHVVGTTQVLAIFASHPRPDPKRLTRLFGIGDAMVYVTHNPVGGAAIGWMKALCFSEQSDKEFYEQTVPKAEQRDTRVLLDPPYLGGDRLEIEAHRAAFRHLTLSDTRLDLLSAVLQAMRRCHVEALDALDVGGRFQRVFLTGGAAEIVHKLIPEYAGKSVHMLQEGSLRGVAKLFDRSQCS